MYSYLRGRWWQHHYDKSEAIIDRVRERAYRQFIDEGIDRLAVDLEAVWNRNNNSYLIDWEREGWAS